MRTLVLDCIAKCLRISSSSSSQEDTGGGWQQRKVSESFGIFTFAKNIPAISL